MRGRRAFGLSALLAALAALGLFAAGASATQFQRPLVETFGSAEQPSFEEAVSIAVDQATGDVLVADGKANMISRFKSSGEPDPFAALGTNMIDGKGNGSGPGSGGSCVPVSTECDETPQNGLDFSLTGNFKSNQIAVDPVSGDIYITQNAKSLVDIFSSDGRYLGQLTQAGAKFQKPCGIAVDSAGTVYVAQNSKLSKFVPTANPPVNGDNTANFKIGGPNPCRLAVGSGSSEGSIFVATTGGSEIQQQILKVNTQSGVSVEFADGHEGFVAVDPTSGNPIVGPGHMFVQEKGENLELTEFDGSATVAGSQLSRLRVEEPGVFAINDYAADASGDVYVADTHSGFARAGILVYGSPVVAPTVSVEPASEITSAGATLSGSVNPEGFEVTECVFEYGLTNTGEWEHTIPCEGSIPTDSNEHEVNATTAGLLPNGVKYNFRLAAKNTNGVTEHSSTGSFSTGSSAETKPATITGLGGATLNGTVHPEGGQYTECFFEWGLESNAGYEHTVPCTPKANMIAPDNGAHPVSAPLTGLQEATTYRFRLIAAKGAANQTGPELTFETFGPPRIDAVRASGATQGTATLEAEINPRGFETSYRFEWGPTTSYGHVTPAGFESIGSGTSPVRVSAELSGLSTGATYHYRVIASGAAGTTPSPDHELETIDSCDLPDGRCFEMVSPREPGPVALPGEGRAKLERESQAAEAPGSLAYEVELGLPEATTGGEILYHGLRTVNGWESVQYSPSLAGAGQQGSGVRAVVLGLSKNLECGVVASKLPLTSDPVARVNIEAGGGNLYRRGPDGSYTLITNVPPEVPKRIGEANREFELIGMSTDCDRVVFLTEQHYTGVPGAGTRRLYEWDEGTLRYVGWVPAASGEAVAEASPGSAPGGQGTLANTYNAVSQDGSRVFFTATSQAGNDIGKQAVFVRLDGTKTLDVSQSSLAPDTGAVYQGATPDGSRVYFTANAGLTAMSSSEGRDLYECHIVAGVGGERECQLADLSVDHEPGGAEAGGTAGTAGIGALVGVADDGSRAYFIARGQLVAGQGSTFTGNQAANTFSLYVYEAASGVVRYVSTVGGRTDELANVTTGNYPNYTSRVSHDGRFLLFESSANLTGYDSGGVPMAYIYSAPTSAGAEAQLECASCRQDRKPSVNSANLVSRVLKSIGTNRIYQPQSLVVRNGEKPIVFFNSKDPLAPGGVEGTWGLYEWAHGQVFNIASDLPGSAPQQGAGTLVFFGASSEGTDLYFVDSAALNWENPEARRAAWDARVGGGFQEPPSVPGCDPTGEGSCQGPAAPAPSAPSVGSTGVSGPGNVKEGKPKPKHHKKKHHKKKHHKKKHHKKKHQAREANADRRAGK